MPVRIPTPVLFCFAADLALGLIFLVDASWGEPTRLFHLEMEANLPTWYASAQLLAVAGCLGQYAYRQFDRSRLDGWLLAALPLVFVALSADETAGVHEWIGYQSDVLLPGGTREGTAFAATGIWMVVLGLPFVALLLFAFRRLRPHFAVPGVWTKYVAGLLVFVAGAAGVEVLVNFVEPGTAAHTLQVVAEEVLEMAGVTTMLWATLDLVGRADLYPSPVAA